MLSFFNIAFLFSTCLFAFSAFFYSPTPGLSLDPHATVLESSSPVTSNSNSSSKPAEATDNILAELVQSLTPIPPQSLTAILPILPHTLDRTADLLHPFLEPLQSLRELLIICPDSITADVRRELQRAFAALDSAAYPDVSLQPWQGYMQVHAASLKSAAGVSTEWVLVMDESGLAGIPDTAKAALLHPPNASVPFGPKGQHDWLDSSPTASCGWGQVQRTLYLLPPFVMPTSSNSEVGLDMNGQSWIVHGSSNETDLGGLLLGSRRGKMEVHTSQLSFNPDGRQSSAIPLFDLGHNSIPETAPSFTTLNYPGHIEFVFFLSVVDDVKRISPFLCRLQRLNPRPALRLLVYDDENHRPLTGPKWTTQSLIADSCIVEYDILLEAPVVFSEPGAVVLLEWLEIQATTIDILLTIEGFDPFTAYLLSAQRMPVLNDTTVIRIPRRDLGYIDWVSSLSVHELKNWHKPNVEIAVITKDRPASLLRLLGSLQNAHYFGDQISLRINVEQDCDSNSLRIIEQTSWPYGRVFVHHRVIHGGLLPAVVESWYPHTNDSYGVLLEDDVEVSPLFYAWIKMTLLRYRYGKPQNRLVQLFGVSLYQQKHLELPIEGRQPFNPRSLFSLVGLPETNTPYLSQVPCSWGALYFPEQWREFHDYLAVRFTETALTMDEDVVPNVRSNYWTKSWKKFFIELIYLRGYLMLYPNYDAFLSLSTNHLEVGSHVKTGEASKLLDLPDHRLPDIEENVETS
ncbi:unnamed protein product [Cyclocybe aegerita]|uniref:Uncharacterized protein n=1 Tax=Cyclocybe aegerita TaxID=1973307 RepID=A0A8S0VSL9_CYCAE|nr:unnamed protein product [Cyclocybe aegerita]